MSDREEREKVIAVLLDMYRWMDGAQYIVATCERIHAIAYAIASIKTDLKYDLMYEEALEQESTTKNNLGVDWESYKDADGNCLDDLILEVLQNNFDCGNTYGYKVADEIIGLLPSVTPQEPKSEWEHDHEILKAYSDGADEVLDMIRAEISALKSNHINDCYDDGFQGCRTNVLHILDKYKTESEPQESEKT